MNTYVLRHKISQFCFGFCSLKRTSNSIGEKISIIDPVDRDDKSKQEIAKQFNTAPRLFITIKVLSGKNAAC